MPHIQHRTPTWTFLYHGLPNWDVKVMHWFTKYPLLECPDCGSKELEHTLYVHHCSGDFQDVLQCGRCEKQLRDIYMRNDSDRVPDDFNPPGYTMNITEEWVRDPPEDEVWDAMWSTED